MELVNPLSAYHWTELDIHGVPMRGVPEKQGYSFSRAGFVAAVDARLNGEPPVDADRVGAIVRRQLRPLSVPTLQHARFNYTSRTVAAMPPYFIIEPTAFCNKACPFCSIHVIQRVNEDGTRGNTMMRWVDFLKLMIEVGDVGESYGLSLYGLGEPLLWREGTHTIADMVDTAKRVGRFKVVNLSTNGDVANLDLLLECDLDDLIISIDGYTAQTYLANRPSTKADDPHAFERTVQRVMQFLDEKAASGRMKPFVRLQIINKADTAPEILEFIRFWITVPGVDDVFVKHLDAMTPWLGDKVVSRAEADLKMAQVKAMPCQHLWAVGWMNASGGLTACCHDAKAELTTAGANIRTGTFANWWEGPFMTQLRAEHMAGATRLPCATCHERDPWLG